MHAGPIPHALCTTRPVQDHFGAYSGASHGHGHGHSHGGSGQGQGQGQGLGGALAQTAQGSGGAPGASHGNHGRHVPGTVGTSAPGGSGRRVHGITHVDTSVELDKSNVLLLVRKPGAGAGGGARSAEPLPACLPGWMRCDAM